MNEFGGRSQPRFLNEEKYVTMKEITDAIRYTSRHIYRLMSQGKFPQSVKFGPRKVVWLESEVLAWIWERYRLGVRSIFPWAKALRKMGELK